MSPGSNEKHFCTKYRFQGKPKGNQGVTKGNQVTDEQACKHPPNAASGLTTNTCLFVPAGMCSMQCQICSRQGGLEQWPTTLVLRMMKNFLYFKNI